MGCGHSPTLFPFSLTTVVLRARSGGEGKKRAGWARGQVCREVCKQFHWCDIGTRRQRQRQRQQQDSALMRVVVISSPRPPRELPTVADWWSVYPYPVELTCFACIPSLTLSSLLSPLSSPIHPFCVLPWYLFVPIHLPPNSPSLS